MCEYGVAFQIGNGSLSLRVCKGGISCPDAFLQIVNPIDKLQETS